MPEPAASASGGGAPPERVPDAIERVLRRFRSMGRDEKMQALVQYAKKLEPVPARYADVDRDAYTVHECQTRVDLFPEVHEGLMHFYADVNTRQSPTVAAVLAVIFSAVNDQPPSVTLGIPADFVRTLMEGMGLHTRETGLNAMVARLKRAALAAEAEPQDDAAT
jgi:cysteine desulfuration protein SufE